MSSAHTLLGALRILYRCTLFQTLYTYRCSCTVLYIYVCYSSHCTLAAITMSGSSAIFLRLDGNRMAVISCSDSWTWFSSIKSSTLFSPFPITCWTAAQSVQLILFCSESRVVRHRLSKNSSPTVILFHRLWFCSTDCFFVPPTVFLFHFSFYFLHLLHFLLWWPQSFFSIIYLSTPSDLPPA